MPYIEAAALERVWVMDDDAPNIDRDTLFSGLQSG